MLAQVCPSWPIRADFVLIGGDLKATGVKKRNTEALKPIPVVTKNKIMTLKKVIWGGCKSAPDSFKNSLNFVSCWVWRNSASSMKHCFFIFLNYFFPLVNSAHVMHQVIPFFVLEILPPWFGAGSSVTRWNRGLVASRPAAQLSTTHTPCTHTHTHSYFFLNIVHFPSELLTLFTPLCWIMQMLALELAHNQ